jgi:hypothetical protein
LASGLASPSWPADVIAVEATTDKISDRIMLEASCVDLTPVPKVGVLLQDFETLRIYTRRLLQFRDDVMVALDNRAVVDEDEFAIPAGLIV